MFEISWLAFYLLLHLLLAALLLPPLILAGRNRLSQQPATMLTLWQIAALLLIVTPLILLQPWALDQQLMPWFQISVGPILEQNTARPEAPLSSDAVQQVRWPLTSQLIYLLAPAFWLWLVLPAGALIRFTKYSPAIIRYSVYAGRPPALHRINCHHQSLCYNIQLLSALC